VKLMRDLFKGGTRDLDIIRIGRQLINSIWSRGLNRDMVGREWIQALPPVSAKAALAFAKATTTQNGPVSLAMKHAPPLFVLKLAIAPLKQLCFHPQLGLKFWRMVHAGQHVRWHHPIGIGASIRLHTQIQSIRATKAGELMRIACRCWADNTLAVTGISDLMVRGKAMPKESGNPPPTHEPTGAALFRTRIQTEAWQPQAYAAASGDRNPIHTKGWAARLAGLPEPIMHGACVLAMITDALAQRLDGPPASMTSIQGRFSRPVIPGQRLTLVGYEDSGKDRLSFKVFNPSTTAVFDRGLLTY
jgi:acyl dehydratase